MALPGRQTDRNRGTNLLLGGCLVVAALYFAREVFIPLALAGLIAFLLAPLAARLRRWGLHRKVADLLVAGLALAAIGAVGWLVLGQIYNLAVELPQYQENITRKVNVVHLDSAGQLTSTIQMLTEVNKQISGEKADESLPPLPVQPSTSRHRSALPLAPLDGSPAGKSANPVTVRVEAPQTPLAAVAAHDIRTLVQPLTTAFAVVIFVIFMLMARDDLRDRAVRLVGQSRIHITTVAMSDAGTRVSRYLLMQFVVNVCYGGVVGLGLWAIGVPHPLLWAVMTALLRFIPYVGILAAGAGPVLVAMAASPNWRTVAWTLGLYVVLELISANAVEPWLYGASTGVSALAILVAAIFWTWLWGLAGLLLSTPLTVCLIVLGRHVPRLEFLGVLFGEETVLDPPQRLYQRVLASDESDAAQLIDADLKLAPHEVVYDRLVIPALSLIEEARHSEELEEERAEMALHCIQEIIEDHWSSTSLTTTGRKLPAIACVAVRDFADEIVCGMLTRLASGVYEGRVVKADLPSADVMDAIATSQPAVLCVVGLPPHALRHVRMRCHELRARFPEITIVACVFSAACDLPDLRARIPLHDAQHVVCSLTQALEYLKALSATPGEPWAVSAPVPPEGMTARGRRGSAGVDMTSADALEHIAADLARAFEAPMAWILVQAAEGPPWHAQCGLPDDDGRVARLLQDALPCLNKNPGEVCLIPDVAEDPDLREQEVLTERSVRFVAGMTMVRRDGTRLGQICVLDTRPRQVTEDQRSCLKALAESVLVAVELRLEQVNSALIPS